MKKKLCLGLFVFIGSALNAQIVDDFDDNDLNSAPQWQGVNSNFLNTSGLLKSNSNTVNAQFGASTDFNLNGELEWRLNVKLSFNPSSVNYIDFFMFADSMNLTKSKNGVFVRMGGSSDEISLFKLSNGIETKLIDGKDGLLNVSSSQYTLSIVFRNDTFSLMHQKQGQSAIQTEGSVRFPIGSFDSYTGMRIRQSTSSFFYKHSFDNLYIGPIIQDTLAPVCDSLKVFNSRTLQCYFNEDCDSLSLRNVNSFVLNGILKPDSIWNIGLNANVLYFHDTFPANQHCQLNIQELKDLSANSMSQTLSFIYFKTLLPSKYDVLISEIMVDPEPSIGLPNAEYVELYNASNKFIELSDLTISDLTTSLNLPYFVLPPDSFYVLYNIPSLNNTSDNIIINNKLGLIIDEVNYDDTWYHDDIKMQGGYSLERIDLTRPCVTAPNWKASESLLGGTPSRRNSIASTLPLDSIAPQLLNYYTSKDSFLTLVFDEKIDTAVNLKWNINGANFHLKPINHMSNSYTYLWPYSPNKDSVYNIKIVGVLDCEQNSNQKLTISFQWPSIPQLHEVVVNEILFNPKTNGKDFIELYNKTNKSFDLSTMYLVELDVNGMSTNYYPLQTNYQLFKPYTYVLITEDTANVCQNYNCGKSQVLKIQCSKLISMPDKEGKVILFNLLNEQIDSVVYSSDWHFAFLNDENGVSLERLSPQMESNDKFNWHSAAAVKGYATPGSVNSQISIPSQLDPYFSLNSRSLSPDMDGFEDLLIMHYKFPEADYLSTIKIFNIEGREMKTIINNKTLGTEGAVTWDGTDSNGDVLPIGVYLVMIECLSPNGELRREKLSVLLAEMF